MPRLGYKERVPAAPFVELLRGELAKLDRDDTLRTESLNAVPSQRLLADRLGVAERTVYRWKNSLDSVTGEPTDNFGRPTVEDAFDRLDVRFEDVYPEISAAEDVELEREAFCDSCHDVVTPIDGLCPWCDRPVSAKRVPARMYCKHEDRMSYPAVDGNCWRCGGELRANPPMAECGCGCGEKVYRFSRRSGRPIRFVLGHAPRALEKLVMLPAEPFAAWLESELRDLDPIASLSRRVGLPREDVLDLLNRRVAEVDKERVRRAVRAAGMEGMDRRRTGGLPRAGSMTFRELYPGFVRSDRCPRCGGKKGPASALCRNCRTLVGVPRYTRRESSITDDVLRQARLLRERQGLPFREVARRVQPRTRYGSIDALKVDLAAAFRERGWSTARLDRAA